VLLERQTRVQPGEQGTGVVVAWHDKAAHAYGFVEVPGAARDLYVRAEQLIDVDRLHVGQRVRFTLHRLQNGRLYGYDVRVIETPQERASWQR
jgi:cold shock CspA family protein